MKLYVKRLRPEAILPTRAHPTDSGLDLYATFPGTCWQGRSAIIPLGIAIDLPPGYEGQVRPRSGLAFNNDITCHWGTIDQEFHQEMMIKIFNLGRQPFFWEKGVRIAQLVIAPVTLPIVEEIDELPEARRGGFGSTGR